MQDDQTRSEGTEEPESPKVDFLVRSVRTETMLFTLNKRLMADIAHKSDIAARNRKLGQYGVTAVEVHNEVVCDFLARFAKGETFQGIVRELCEGRRSDDADTVSKESISIAIGLLCNKHAQRLIYRIEKERPTGSATDVMGEEVQKEQESISQEEATKSADRQMLAVMTKIGRHRGVHRADVYGVADFSRGAMRDNFTRMASNQGEEVLSFLLDWGSTIWSPATKVQQEAWKVAFQGKSVADVLFGMNPTTGAHLPEAVQTGAIAQDYSDYACEHEGVVYDIPCYYHAKVRAGLTTPSSHKEDETGKAMREVYPVAYPYKPLVLIRTSQTRPKVTDAAFAVHQQECGSCGHLRLSNPWSARAAKLGLTPKLGIKCPPGVVSKWRKVFLGSLLPESAAPGTNQALRRALEDFGQWVREERVRLLGREGRKGVLPVQGEDARKMVDVATMRAFRKDRFKVGKGEYPVEWGYVVDTTNLVRHGTFRTYWTEEATGGKDRKRFSFASQNLFPTMQDNPDFWILSEEEHIDDVWEFTLATVKPGERVKLPVSRNKAGMSFDDTIREMWEQEIEVGYDGVKGLFVQGMHGVIEHQRKVQNGRKAVKYLIAHRGFLALSLCGMPNGM